MRVKITKWNEASPYLNSIGLDIILSYVPNKGAYAIYDIIDKPSFMLAVIKHGIEYKEVSDAD